MGSTPVLIHTRRVPTATWLLLSHAQRVRLLCLSNPDLLLSPSNYEPAVAPLIVLSSLLPPRPRPNPIWPAFTNLRAHAESSSLPNKSNSSTPPSASTMPASSQPPSSILLNPHRSTKHIRTCDRS